MKVNWGTGIVIAFVLFMSFILYFVIKAATNKDYAHEMVSEEYYKDELMYQQDIEKLTNTLEVKREMKLVKTEEGIEISFPKYFQHKEIKGMISLYRPSNQSLDVDYPFVLSNTYTLLIPDQKLVDGRWDIKLTWKDMGKAYLYKKSIVY
ncbi:FixH family protein [Flavobacteriaceae bacterium F08102]|nr:FixH family protein [Flavobacteriaceae bacterium F08102]